MATRASPYTERIATLEAHYDHLQEALLRHDAALTKTVNEFQEAIKSHREEHKESTDTFWRAATLVLTPVAAIAASIITYLITKVI